MVINLKDRLLPLMNKKNGKNGVIINKKKRSPTNKTKRNRAQSNPSRNNNY